MRIWTASMLTAVMLMPIFLLPPPVSSEERGKIDLPEGVYLELTRDFYEALKQGDKVYTNDPSQEYLRRISVSSRFMVETNLKILEQQERILRKLDQVLLQLQKK